MTKSFTSPKSAKSAPSPGHTGLEMNPLSVWTGPSWLIPGPRGIYPWSHPPILGTRKGCPFLSPGAANTSVVLWHLQETQRLCKGGILFLSSRACPSYSLPAQHRGEWASIMGTSITSAPGHVVPGSFCLNPQGLLLPSPPEPGSSLQGPRRASEKNRPKSAKKKTPTEPRMCPTRPTF